MSHLCGSFLYIMIITIVKYLIIKGIDFQYLNDSIECNFRYDLPYDFKSLTQLISIYMDKKTTTFAL
jgi:hypothetical protein